MNQLNLPSNEEILFALSELPLGQGAEAKVYKIHTSPKFTVRTTLDCPPASEMAKIINETPRIEQKNIFGHRNYAQTLAYWKDPKNPDETLLTINLYCPGISIEVQKPGRPKPDPEEALIRTKVLTETILNLPDDAFDKLYDDLHFLSSRRYTIDTGNGIFTNTGNILYSAVDNRMFIIDLQPIVSQRPGIAANSAKGLNTPLYLTRGLTPGAYCYRAEHAKDPDLINYRTQLVDRIISGAERNNLNDLGGYLGTDMNRLLPIWNKQLSDLNIPEHLRENMLSRLSNIKDEQRYATPKEIFNYVRVVGNEM